MNRMTKEAPLADTVQPIPGGRQVAVPYLIVRGAEAAIDFYKRAFGAVETMRIEAPKGTIGHAEMRIGEAEFMLADEFPDYNAIGPATLGGTTVAIHIYVADVDAFIAQAVAAGGTLERPVADQFYGDRSGKVIDPFGHAWWFASRKQEMSAAEMQKRATELFG